MCYIACGTRGLLRTCTVSRVAVVMNQDGRYVNLQHLVLVSDKEDGKATCAGRHVA